MQTHQVKQGEDLISIALEYRIPGWEDVYNHDANKRLKQKRPDPMCLYPGDIVYMPDIVPIIYSLSTNKSHSIQVEVPKTRIHLTFSVDEADLLAGIDYELKFSEQVIKNTTTKKGEVIEDIPNNIKLVTITFYAEGALPLDCDIEIGALDPSDEVSGVQARLRNLGFYQGSVDNKYGVFSKKAIVGFQGQYDLEATGILNEQTIDKINEVYDS